MKKQPKLTDQLRIEAMRYCRIAPASEIMERIVNIFLTKTNTKGNHHVSTK